MSQSAAECFMTLDFLSLGGEAHSVEVRGTSDQLYTLVSTYRVLRSFRTARTYVSDGGGLLWEVRAED